MRTTAINTPFYVPNMPPTDQAEFQRYVYNELQRIAACAAILAKGHVEFVDVAPPKPREGDIVGADGVNFKPNGTGAKGVWAYYSGVWNFLG